MESHVRILGILNIVLGALGILTALVILVVFGGISGLIAAAGGSVGDSDFPAIGAIPLLGVIFGVVFVLLVLFSLPGIITGIGLVQFRPWARTVGIVLSAINLPGVPFGTAMGVYGLWVLLNTQTADLFERRRLAAG